MNGVIMLGHGSTYGLLSVGQFPDSGLYVVKDMMYRLFINKIGSIFIWCNADEYVKRYRLDGLYCGMFISEISEAYYCGFREIKQSWLDESNIAFASIMAKYINLPLPVLYKKLIKEYSLLTKDNPIAKFNLERLYLSSPKTNAHMEKDMTCRIDKL